MNPVSTADTIIPAALLSAIQAVAAEEQREPADLVREALERYLEDVEWKKLLSYGQETARTLGLTEADVPRLIAEARREKREESLKAAE